MQGVINLSRHFMLKTMKLVFAYNFHFDRKFIWEKEMESEDIGQCCDFVLFVKAQSIGI